LTDAVASLAASCVSAALTCFLTNFLVLFETFEVDACGETMRLAA
jgi:hypothetical protein